jgi:hypothetical protein
VTATSPHPCYRGRTAARRAAWTLAFLLPFAFLACGRKAPPRPPEDVVPKTITDLSAKNEAQGIQLSWSRPVAYADGTRMEDLGGFSVERAVGPEPRTTFTPLALLEVTDRDRFRPIKRFQYLDSDIQPGMTYQYRVVSSTTDRYLSGPSNVVTVVRAVPGEETHALLPTP